MKKKVIFSFILLALFSWAYISGCQEGSSAQEHPGVVQRGGIDSSLFWLDTARIPEGKYGDAVRYGRQLMMNTAYLIGPDGVNGKYLGNKMNCNNCHEDAGTKPYSFNLQMSFRSYPQFRAREGKVLTIAERINNCIMHPHLGTPLPLDSKEMIGFIAYLKWISDSSKVTIETPGVKNLAIELPATAASSHRGALVYKTNCARCHGAEGQGLMDERGITYLYPPLWGPKSYQPGSSMHRIVKMAQWLVANMPHDLANYSKPVLSAASALDVAAFVNDDSLHIRPTVKEFQYPDITLKAIDYDRGPYADTFSEKQHKYGPYQPIIDYYAAKGKEVSF